MLTSVLASAPEIRSIDHIIFPDIKANVLSSGLSLYQDTDQRYEVAKVQLVFDAGRTSEIKQLASRFTAMMLKEGTEKHTNSELSEYFDYRGATVQYSFDFDYVYLTLFCLSRQVVELLPRLAEMVYDSALPPTELERLQMSSLQKIRYDLSKGDHVSYREITEKIFGSLHPYGYNSSETSIQALQLADVREHYERTIQTGPVYIFVSGYVPDEAYHTLESAFAGHCIQPRAYPDPTSSSLEESTSIQLDGQDQMSLKLGMRTFSRTHEDHHALQLASTALGGYFGSRLMSKIREELGLTYNIYSMMESYRHDGCMVIGAELNAKSLSMARVAIHREMARLRAENVEADELELVLNYLKGNMLSRTDGPFQRIRSVRNVVLNGLPEDYYPRMFDFLQSMTADRLRLTAEKYLNTADFYEVIVGDSSST